MKTLITLAVLVLSGCGLETAGSAATVGKLQADNAKQATENLGQIKASIEASTKENEARNKALGDAGKSE